MSAGIALDDAAIMSTSLEGILYGFSLLMFIGTVWVLSTRAEGRHAPDWKMISIAVVLLVLSTVHMVVDIVRIDEGLVKYRDTFPGGPVAFFADIAQNSFVIKNAIYTLQTLVGDGVVIYRCYVVWQSIWIIILPAMLWCSVAVTGVCSVYSASQATVNATNVFAKETGQWITAFFSSTLATNLLSSGLLAYRIWSIERSVSSIRVSKKDTMMPVFRVLVDAAILYSATLFTALLCFVNANNGQFVVLDMIMPIISIAFYMVLIRIAMRRRNTDRVPSSQRGMAPIDSQEASSGTKRLQVHVSQFSKNESTALHQDVERDALPLRHKGELSGAAYEV
ncbi:hypothetical protein HD554DRAFT_1522177 [Boletus coccyginus]|nr:hypothetical protein HD554DRAFT_1522177 [Boletus coccyginus]